MYKRFNRWSSDHPFMLAVIVILIIVIPGFLRIEQIAGSAKNSADQSKTASSEAKAASSDASDAVDAVEAQAARNTEIVGCLVSYANKLTDSLQDRDAVNKTGRAAEKETWRGILRLVNDPTPEPDANVTLVSTILRYVQILNRLDHNDSINPYPALAACLIDGGDADEAFDTIAFVQSPMCFGLRVTVRGGPGNDTLIGTDHDDVIRGFRGRDLIYAGRGEDTLCGGKGNDVINGGQQRDRARGNRGNDFCVLVEEQRGC